MFLVMHAPLIARSFSVEKKIRKKIKMKCVIKNKLNTNNTGDIFLQL